MTVQPHILQAFTTLGQFLRDFGQAENQTNEPWSNKLNDAIVKAGQQNGWFTKNNVMNALQSWGGTLTEDKLKSWLANYDFNTIAAPKTIAIIMAGNIPLVGFHDFLSVLVSGHKVLAKLSSNDAVLLPVLAEFLIEVSPNLEDKIQFTKDKLEDFDAVIATGSNNTSRYFDYYFGKYPHIIRRNRNSVAVLTANESETNLKALGLDIFQYFGLGCRSVSKLFVPKNYDFKVFFEAIFDYQDIINTHKYANNYDYNKAVFLMSEFQVLDNNFLLLKEDEGYASPIGTLYYEHYDNLPGLERRLKNEALKLQCIVGGAQISDSISFGTTQKPSLNDYADGVDTVEFLLNL